MRASFPVAFADDTVFMAFVNSAVLLRHCRTEFMKQVFPIFHSPQSPETESFAHNNNN